MLAFFAMFSSFISVFTDLDNVIHFQTIKHSICRYIPGGSSLRDAAATFHYEAGLTTIVEVIGKLNPNIFGYE
jgi:hypothetical protein